MKTALALSLVVGAAILVGPALPAGSAAPAATTHLRATLDARHVVTPRNKPWKPPAAVAKAHGSFTGALSGTAGRQLHWRITFAGVGSNPLRIADVHYGKPGQFGAILVRLCGPCESGQSGTKTVKASVARSIRAGMAWVTVITGTYPNGVIRGQIKVS